MQRAGHTRESSYEPGTCSMTNTIAVVLGGLILSAIAVDVLAFDSENLLFLARKLDAFIEWLAFWR